MKVLNTYMVRLHDQWCVMHHVESPNGPLYMTPRLHGSAGIVPGHDILTKAQATKLIDDTTVYLAS